MRLLDVKILLGALVVFLVTLLAGCSINDGISVSDYIEKPTAIVKDYRIGIDDVLTINVWRNPDLNITVPVRPDGKISAPLIGDIKVGGFTATEVAQEIKKGLAKFIRDPQATVIISGLNSHEYLTRIRVTGAVSNQVSTAYRQGMTVLDAILLAGGVTDFANSNGAILFRKEQGRYTAINILLDDILYQGGLETNILLKPGDIISIPERIF